MYYLMAKKILLIIKKTKNLIIYSFNWNDDDFFFVKYYELLFMRFVFWNNYDLKGYDRIVYTVVELKSQALLRKQNMEVRFHILTQFGGGDLFFKTSIGLVMSFRISRSRKCVWWERKTKELMKVEEKLKTQDRN